MKKLILDDEQRKKLIEMIRRLFPEIYSKDTNIFDIRDGDDDLPCIMHNNGKEWDIVIHWYEFVIQHLCSRICGDNLSDLIITKQLASSLPNPIDYLYIKFKTIY